MRHRIIVDPGSTSHRDPGLSVVSFTRAGCTPKTVPKVGETVEAVSPNDEGMDPGNPGVPATVERIDMKYRLMYLRVAWDQ